MLTLRSPAKVNLFLRILGRRADGYHELASLFQAIDLCDTLQFSLSEKDFLASDDLSLPKGEENLIWKAIALFRKKRGVDQPLFISLKKRIPVQAGLGGGSGNAATALWAYNELLGRPVAEAQLRDWSAEIGSDVSFFFSQGTAYCTGRGEKIQALSPLPSRSFWVIKPAENVSTPFIYKQVQPSSLLPRDPLLALEQALGKEIPFFNDLEKAAFSAFPSLCYFKDQLLEKGFFPVLMSGSGSSFLCFGQGEIPKEAIFSQRVSFLSRSEKGWY